MVAKLRFFMVLGSAGLLLVFILFFLGEAASVAGVAESYLPGSEPYVLWSLVGALTLFLALPVILFFRLPARLVPPKSDDPADLERHLRAVRRRLQANPRLADRSVESREEIEAALDTLAQAADDLTKETARSVFLVTAVSPNGRFDLLTVLSAQSRLVWNIARIYSERPALRDLITLYANVAATSYVAGELDELDLRELVQPIVVAAAPSASGAIPGLSGVATLAANAVSSGAANAYLTLRIGIITRRYCGSLVRPERGSLRHSAMLEAGKLLMNVVGNSASQVVKAIAGGAARAGMSGATKVGGYVRDASSAGVTRVGTYARETGAAVASRVKRDPNGDSEAQAEAMEDARADGVLGTEGSDTPPRKRRFRFRRGRDQAPAGDPEPGAS